MAVEEQTLDGNLTALLYKYSYKRDIHLTTLINKDLKIEGDDAVDFLMEFSSVFDVTIDQFPIDDYFYSEGELSNLWIMKLLGLNKNKKPFYVYQLTEAIKLKKLI